MSIYDIPEGQQSEAEASFAQALARIGEAEGLRETYFLLDCEGDRAMAITFWDSHAAMTASRVAASLLRGEAARSVGGEVVSVGEFKVATQTSRAAAAVGSG
ncbi:MAG: hypothetical protein ABR521_03735 [Gaiellaceae bacterium]